MESHGLCVLKRRRVQATPSLYATPYPFRDSLCLPILANCVHDLYRCYSPAGTSGMASGRCAFVWSHLDSVLIYTQCGGDESLLAPVGHSHGLSHATHPRHPVILLRRTARGRAFLPLPQEVDLDSTWVAPRVRADSFLLCPVFLYPIL
ncbi:hypothetical protein AG1IA_03237 [Rhizoctonia solani AG-1 IA]|uniref:Uncharacterized protein n=1 Tax=Thanatephorus cucumeris (strain AG1-IA) TaxID=983506 RepID=L8WXC5_THACA|nr:hypothetical protein AG1IA_03237 [Rhizoctonia solani AG-1 IA]